MISHVPFSLGRDKFKWPLYKSAPRIYITHIYMCIYIHMCLHTYYISARSLMGSQASHSSRTHTHRKAYFLLSITAFPSGGWTHTTPCSRALLRTMINILYDVWPSTLIYMIIYRHSLSTQMNHRSSQSFYI